VDIAAADAAGRNAHQNFAVARRGLRKIGDLQMLVLREQKSFHA